MERIAKFEKVSFEQFKNDWMDALKEYGFNDEDLEKYTADSYIRFIYDAIKLPKRATTGSAGYDFYLPHRMYFDTDRALRIPTGIRCKIADGWVLKIYPRSGLGFKYGVKLENTVGIIDSDYYNSDNEGHIMIKLHNGRSELFVDSGKAFCQGIFLPFGITEDDDTDGVRNGGFGSTSK